MNREQMLIQAVETAKTGEFGLTGIKVELEAVFSRENHEDNCTWCNEGQVTCDMCEGSGDHWCDHCEGEGRVEVRDDEGEPIMVDGAQRMEDCPECSGGDNAECDLGRHLCDDCEGSGTITCSDCGGDWGSEGNTNWGDVKRCQDAILERLVKHKLAEPLVEGEENRYGYKFKPKYPLVFCKTYYDATVDTEMTFTLALDKPKNILHLPTVIEAFTALKDDIGNGISVAGAGMHMAFLNGEAAVYPASRLNSDGPEYRRWKNFSNSMILLMPALFFLASQNSRSRRLAYRRPKVGCQDLHFDDHTTAINYSGGALEFRVFEPCYEQPTAALDNAMVMFRCLRYWTENYTRNHLQRVANNIRFGNDSGSEELQRLYVTSEHIDLLNRGLRLIKPDWYSLHELKTQRNFKVTKKHTKLNERKAQEQALIEYKQYENRIGWDSVIRQHNYISDHLQRYRTRGEEITPDKLAEAEKEADLYVERHKELPETQDEWCKQMMPKLVKAGEYTLCAE